MAEPMKGCLACQWIAGTLEAQGKEFPDSTYCAEAGVWGEANPDCLYSVAYQEWTVKNLHAEAPPSEPVSETVEPSVEMLTLSKLQWEPCVKNDGGWWHMTGPGGKNHYHGCSVKHGNTAPEDCSIALPACTFNKLEWNNIPGTTVNVLAPPTGDPFWKPTVEPEYMAGDPTGGETPVLAPGVKSWLNEGDAEAPPQGTVVLPGLHGEAAWTTDGSAWNLNSAFLMKYDFPSAAFPADTSFEGGYESFHVSFTVGCAFCAWHWWLTGDEDFCAGQNNDIGWGVHTCAYANDFKTYYECGAGATAAPEPDMPEGWTMCSIPDCGGAFHIICFNCHTCEKNGALNCEATEPVPEESVKFPPEPYLDSVLYKEMQVLVQEKQLWPWSNYGCLACAWSHFKYGWASRCITGSHTTKLSLKHEANPDCTYYSSFVKACAADGEFVPFLLFGHTSNMKHHYTFTVHEELYNENQTPRPETWAEGTGCKACQWKYHSYQKQGYKDKLTPCEFSDPTAFNTQCGYFQTYRGWLKKKSGGNDTKTVMIGVAVGYSVEGWLTTKANQGKKKGPVIKSQDLKAWPFQQPYIGCDACAWYSVTHGGVGPCDKQAPTGTQFGPGKVNTKCYCLEEWENAGKPKPPCTTVVPEFSLPAGLYGRERIWPDYDAAKNKFPSNEARVGHELGLDFHLDLAAECADFYLLERLVNDLFERKEVPVLDKDGKPVYDEKVTLGPKVAGTRRRQRIVTKTMRMRYVLTDVPVDHSSGLRKELRAYSALRWLQRTEERLAHEFSLYLSLACGGELRHAPTRYRLADYRFKMQCPGKKHTCSAELGCFWSPTERLERYWATAVKHEGERHAAWKEWHELCKEDPAGWMQDCADGMNYLPWRDGGGFGGKLWGVAAQYTADFLRGDMPASAYIDRCWTLQHNGGCIFNKMYSMPNARSREHSHGAKLQYVLGIQAIGQYDALAHFASPEVASMWRDHAHDRDRDTYLTKLIDKTNARLDALEEVTA